MKHRAMRFLRASWCWELSGTLPRKALSSSSELQIMTDILLLAVFLAFFVGKLGSPPEAK
jgi:hypothetical protein